MTKPGQPAYWRRRALYGTALWSSRFVLVTLAFLAACILPVLCGAGWSDAGQPPLLVRGEARADSLGGTGTTDDVVLVGVFNDSIGPVQTFALEHAVNGVTSDVRTWRAIHGRLMQRALACRPRVVVWEYFFSTQMPGDEAFVTGLKALEKAGIPVVLGSQSYGEDGRPDHNPIIYASSTNGARHGFIVLREQLTRVVEGVVAMQRPDGRVLASMALATFASVLCPDAAYRVEWTGRRHSLDVVCEVASDGPCRRHRVGLSSVYRTEGQAHPVFDASLAGCRAWQLRRPGIWKERTLRYEDLLNWDIRELQDRIEGKIVIIGDLRAAVKWPSVIYGRLIVEETPPCYLLAGFVTGLINDAHWRRATYPVQVLLLILLFADIGCRLPIRWAAWERLQPKYARRVVCLALMDACLLSFAVAIGSSSEITSYCGVCAFGFLVSMWPSFVIESWRYSKRRVFRNVCTRALRSAV